MKTTTLIPLLLAAQGSLSAPVPFTSEQLAEFEAQTITIVRVSRHRGPFDSFIASEEVSSTLRLGKDGLPTKTSDDGDSFDNSEVDLDGLDISAPSPILDIEQPLPTSFLLALTAATSKTSDLKDSSVGKGDTEGEKPSPGEVNWAIALLKDVYADYRSVSPCWRQDGTEAEATTRIQRLVQGKADMLVIAGVACIVMFILVLEALFTSIQSLRQGLVNAGAIRLEGPERVLDSSDDKKQPIDAEYHEKKLSATA